MSFWRDTIAVAATACAVVLIGFYLTRGRLPMSAGEALTWLF